MTKIDDFFNNLNLKKIWMEVIHEEYIRAYNMANDDCSMFSSSSNFNEVVVSKSNNICGIDNLFKYAQEKEHEYELARKEYENEKKLCMLKINKLSNKVYGLIIKYAYIEGYNNKTILDKLEKFHRIYYSEDYFRRIKTRAVKKFENLI